MKHINHLNNCSQHQARGWRGLSRQYLLLTLLVMLSAMFGCGPNQAQRDRLERQKQRANLRIEFQEIEALLVKQPNSSELGSFARRTLQTRLRNSAMTLAESNLLAKFEAQLDGSTYFSERMSVHANCLVPVEADRIWLKRLELAEETGVWRAYDSNAHIATIHAQIAAGRASARLSLALDGIDVQPSRNPVIAEAVEAHARSQYDALVQDEARKLAQSMPALLDQAEKNRTHINPSYARSRSLELALEALKALLADLQN